MRKVDDVSGLQVTGDVDDGQLGQVAEWNLFLVVAAATGPAAANFSPFDCRRWHS